MCRQSVPCQNKTLRTIFLFFMLTALCGDDYQLIVMDRGLAKTTLARRRQFSTGDTDRPKYSDLDPIGHHPRSISKFGLFVLSSPVNRLSRVRPMKHIRLESVVLTSEIVFTTFKPNTCCT